MNETSPTVQPADPPPYHIYAAMVAVGAELAKVGISKDRKNEQQNFRFRGIDDVMNTICPIFARHDVLFLVHYDDFPDVERVTAKGGTLIFSKVRGNFTFISAKDGSSVQVSTLGSAMDSGDKSCNKAMSASLKYALLQTFLIPTEASEDADAITHEPSVPKPPDGFDEWFHDMTMVVPLDGFEEVRNSWRRSPEVFRDYAMKFHKDDWDGAKKRAIDVDKAATEAAAKAARAAKKAATQ